jgi:hypothetical protein
MKLLISLSAFGHKKLFLRRQPYRPALRRKFTALQNRNFEAGEINLFKKLQHENTQPERKIIHCLQSSQHGNFFTNFKEINVTF